MYSILIPEIKLVQFKETYFVTVRIVKLGVTSTNFVRQIHFVIVKHLSGTVMLSVKVIVDHLDCFLLKFLRMTSVPVIDSCC